jgi:formylglycine-generating enzyme required for sulfatase activity
MREILFSLGSSRTGAQLSAPAIVLDEIPEGDFMMGSPEDEVERGEDEGPCHLVTIPRRFWIAKYPVTQAEFECVMGYNPSYFTSRKPDYSSLTTSRFPVETVSWYEAVDFCGQLTELSKERGLGWSFDLPTEAQWEYACRAETASPFTLVGVDGYSFSSRFGNCHECYPYGVASSAQHLGRTTTVGLYPANRWGLHDMHGQVFEWCRDEYEPDIYRQSQRDCRQVVNKSRVVRGGAWSMYARFCRSAERSAADAIDRFYDVGFRIVAFGTNDGVSQS